MKTTKTTKTNATKINVNYFDVMNAKTENGQLLYGTKNNLRVWCIENGYNVNGKSNDYKPRDAYLRFDNGLQFQLQYSCSRVNGERFNGFNVRLTHELEKVYFEKYGFTFGKCNDGKRVFVSNYLSFDKVDFKQVLDDLNALQTKTHKQILIDNGYNIDDIMNEIDDNNKHTHKYYNYLVNA